MKHGRPTAHEPHWESDWRNRSCDHWKDHLYATELDWRREHAHRVWNAVQAVFAVVAACELQRMYERVDVRAETWMDCKALAGWVSKTWRTDP